MAPLATPPASNITVRPALLLMGHISAIGTRHLIATCPDTCFVYVSDVTAVNTSSVMKRCTSLPASVIHVHQHDCSVLGVAVAQCDQIGLALGGGCIKKSCEDVTIFRKLVYSLILGAVFTGNVENYI